MSIGSEPVDDNARPIQGWDPTNHRPAVPEIDSTSVDAGVVYGTVKTSSGGGGTQYVDGVATPANPTGTVLVFDNSGTLVDVGIDHPYPVNVQNANANGQATMASSAPVVLASNQASIPVAASVKASNAVDATNSTATPLAANGVYGGNSASSIGATAISIEVFADQASAALGLSIQQSQDGTNWDIKDAFSVVASTTFQTTIMLVGQFYKVVYTNGATLQGAFRLQTMKLTNVQAMPRVLTAVGNLSTGIMDVNGVSIATTGLLGNSNISMKNVVPIGLVVQDSSNVNNGTFVSTSNSNGLGYKFGLATTHYLDNGATLDKAHSNMDNIALAASAARTTTFTSADQINYNGRGVIVTLDVTAVSATGTLTLEIDMKDPVSGKYIPLLTATAVASVSTIVYTVYPGITASANVAAANPLPRTWRVVVTAGNGVSMTYSVGASVIV